MLSETPARKRVYTDCLANVKTLKGCEQAATDGKKKMARVWCGIFAMTDEDESASTDWLVWLPAHKSQHHIGVAKKSCGTAMTSLDWMANAAVDELAKAAANETRVSASTREKLNAA